jgi:sulfur carrier protein
VKIIFNGEDREVEDRLTVAKLLVREKREPRHVAVEVNLEVAPRARHAEWVLEEGDRVEIVTLVGGG